MQTFKFINNNIEIYENAKLITTASKQQFYKNEYVTYKNTKGIKLGGTIFIPKNASGKAIVLIHGSGQQDRNGYASIIRLLADIFAREGITVLTYDKQGVGHSEGNSEYESFMDLADDAVAGIDFLKTRKDLNLSKIGLGGSSQAGWIIAKAIEKNEANRIDEIKRLLEEARRKNLAYEKMLTEMQNIKDDTIYKNLCLTRLKLLLLFFHHHNQDFPKLHCSLN